MWNFDIIRYMLASYYKANQIRYFRSKEVYSKVLRRRAILEPVRKDFAVLLANFIVDKKTW